MRNRGFEIVSDFKDKYINLPTRKTSKSAGYDIEAAEDKIIKAGQMAVIATGLKAYMQDDEYLGTISLKNIDLKNKNAEYAISTRKKARGTGANQQATESLLKYGFDKLQLHRIYLNVLSSNKRAISFYKKCGFIYEGKFKDHLFIDDRYQDLEWYAICKK